MNCDTSNNRINLRFAAPWSQADYAQFLRCKKLPEYELRYDHEADAYTLSTNARFASIIGAPEPVATRPALPFASHLFDYQRYFTEVALTAERFAVWADTGLGKTQIGLEFARQVQARTGGRVLIVTPLNILEQWRDEARRWFGLELEAIGSRAQLRAWCAGNGPGLAIVNPDKFIPPAGEDQKINECNRLAGVVLDESSLLKSGGGVVKWAVIHSFKGVQYKLSLTATPAPNDTMEYASQASFLEKLRSEGEILWTYFVRGKDGEWKVKEHARDAFYRFMSSWSVYLRNPANYGFADNLKDLPPPEYVHHTLTPTAEQMEFAVRIPSADGQMGFWQPEKLGMVERTKLSQVAKGFLYADGKKPRRITSPKPGLVADLARNDAREGRQVLVWTLFDEESDILRELIEPLIPGSETLTGRVKQADRQAMIERFRVGETPVLITRARMLGYGLNFQNCTSMIFSGFDDSYERLYQSVRRAYRYGQMRTVRVHFPVIPELEGAIWRNLQEKQAAFERDTALAEACYIKAMRGIGQ